MAVRRGLLEHPGYSRRRDAPERIRVRYQDVDGKSHIIDIDGMFARVIQHEIDHLDGKLFIDYLSTGEKTLLKPRLKKIAERYVS